MKSSHKYYLLEFRHWSAWKSLGWRIWHRTHNRWMDLRAVLAGACNARTWDPEAQSYSGGYPHWRCGKRRGHADGTDAYSAGRRLHRFHNSVWEGPGHQVEYAPIPVLGLEEHSRTMDQILPFRKLTSYRHGIDTMRRARLVRRSYERAYAKQRAERS